MAFSQDRQVVGVLFRGAIDQPPLKLPVRPAITQLRRHQPTIALDGLGGLDRRLGGLGRRIMGGLLVGMWIPGLGLTTEWDALPDHLEAESDVGLDVAREAEMLPRMPNRLDHAPLGRSEYLLDVRQPPLQLGRGHGSANLDREILPTRKLVQGTMSTN